MLFGLDISDASDPDVLFSVSLPAGVRPVAVDATDDHIVVSLGDDEDGIFVVPLPEDKDAIPDSAQGYTSPWVIVFAVALPTFVVCVALLLVGVHLTRKAGATGDGGRGEDDDGSTSEGASSSGSSCAGDSDSSSSESTGS